MRNLVKIAILLCLLGSATASADIVLIKKSQIDTLSGSLRAATDDQNLNEMEELSNKLADSIVNRKRNLTAEKASHSGDMYIHLVKVKRPSLAKF